MNLHLYDVPACRCADCLLYEVRNGPTEPDKRITLRRAEMIAGKLSVVTKMPGYSYGLDALACKRDEELMVKEGSVCSGCYALGGWYQFPSAAKARGFRQNAIHDPKWVGAMVTLIKARCVGKDKSWFRWHDSGDLAGVWHLRSIVSIAYQTESVKHWLPTREMEMVNDYLELVENDTADPFPPNLVVRLSGDFYDKPVDLQGFNNLKHLTTSTVHRFTGIPVEFARRSDSIECLAPTRDHKCGSCRACWSPDVRNVSYVFHD